MVEQAAERLRKPEGGTERDVGDPASVDSIGDAAKRAGTPAGMVARTRGDRGARRRDFEEGKSTERMNPDRQAGERSAGMGLRR